MILITGGNGFIGRSLIAFMEKRAMPFRAVSRNPAPGCMALGDMTKDPDWSVALRDVDVVIHLAGRAHVLKEEADPAQAFQSVNVDATLALARQAAATGVRRFVFVSSIKASGGQSATRKPFLADDMPRPADEYGRSKLEAERQLFQLGRDTGMEITVVRPPLVYGPGVPANFALMLKWAGSGLPSPFGAINNCRSLVYVENLCDLLARLSDHPHAAGQVFLVSDGVDFSTAELFSKLAKLQGKKPINLPIPVALLTGLLQLMGKSGYQDRLLANLQVDIGKTCRLLQWVPPISSEEGMRVTVENFRNRPEARN
ncbi:NAD-dependent epimerase/dehydratase family protein [Neorhizobium sp. JUb45]|uniref:NAD-dependent epimerase/dehydratase family protein n=1 Tax=unclassified Neorhizobium TaxID=2629175 RepID=UPI0010451130|nr:NAD-dependent epimerase/dehydratase family protein [Neorhizobium sp. JUb45]TCQ99684.1 UDP-glucose 4-epimerase [Neorhizobium sp. JUb45]